MEDTRRLLPSHHVASIAEDCPVFQLENMSDHVLLSKEGMSKFVLYFPAWPSLSSWQLLQSDVWSQLLCVFVYKSIISLFIKNLRDI